MKATPHANTTVPTMSPAAFGTRPMIASPTAETASATPDSRAAPNRSGQVAPDDPQADDDERVGGQRQAGALEPDLRDVERQEGQEAGHPPQAEQDDDPGEDAGGMDQRAARLSLAGRVGDARGRLRHEQRRTRDRRDAGPPEPDDRCTTPRRT